jgi:hypothetical protein
MLLVRGRIPGATRYSREYAGIPQALTVSVHATSAVFVKSLKVVEPKTPLVPMMYDTGRVAPGDIIV